MSLVSLDFLAIVIDELNREFLYKLEEHTPLGTGDAKNDFFVLFSNGNNHTIHFLGKEIWTSRFFIEMEDMKPEEEMDFYEKNRFNKWLKLVAQDYIDAIGQIKF